jgi:SAM-dependent methyltransferase
LSTGFTAGERNWQARLDKLRDVVRQELVARQLSGELPPAPVRIIDLGCGQGTQALRLARRGYELTGVDASADLLARFERDLAAEPAEVRVRVRVERGLIANRIGVTARADRLADLTGRLAGHGLEVTAWYGVRVFTDTVPETPETPGDAEPPPDLETLLACEERAGQTDPYRQVAALLHLIARLPSLCVSRCSAAGRGRGRPGRRAVWENDAGGGTAVAGLAG